MQERTRQRILLVIGILLAVLLGLWWYSGFSLDFMRFFAAEPGAPVAPIAAQLEEAPCVPRPACLDASPACLMTQPAGGWCAPSNTVVCAPLKQTVKVGVPATITATGGRGPYQWFAPTGNPAAGLQSTFTVTYDAVGKKKVTVQSGRADGSTNVDSVACTIIVQL